MVHIFMVALACAHPPGQGGRLVGENTFYAAKWPNTRGRINLKKSLLYLIPYSIVRWILHGGEELKLRGF